ncbi:hypothetical protein ES703_92083 [subsurface metagenome]
MSDYVVGADNIVASTLSYIDTVDIITPITHTGGVCANQVAGDGVVRYIFTPEANATIPFAYQITLTNWTGTDIPVTTYPIVLGVPAYNNSCPRFEIDDLYTLHDVPI